MKHALIPGVLGLLLAATTPLASHAVGPDQLLAPYRQSSPADFDAAAGRALWHQDFGGRSCTSCHGTDLTAAGRHATTGKPIGPLAPSVDADRLTDPAKVEKWFERNCRWTLGRPCTAEEKGHVLTWLLTL